MFCEVQEGEKRKLLNLSPIEEAVQCTHILSVQYLHGSSGTKHNIVTDTMQYTVHVIMPP